MDKAAFYDSVRHDLFGGVLRQEQVDGMEAILDFWDNPPVTPTGVFETNWKIRVLGWLAYMLATAFHETARTMQPITEYGSRSYFDKYDAGTSIGRVLGNTKPDDGYMFRGRGFVQLTGRANYAKMTPIVQGFYPNAPDFTVDPDAVKTLDYATVIMFYGMFVGTFTGKALKNYIGDPDKGQMADFVQARRVINRLDKAPLIAGQAIEFEQALEVAGAKA